MQSTRLLLGMHNVCSHDLPNQLVAMQGLLQMLHADEFDRLGKDGQEYVTRMINVMKRTSAMARFLKEMQKLVSYVARPETLALGNLSREIQGALKQQFPHMDFVFDWHGTTPPIVVDPKTFLQALSEILTSVAASFGQACRLQARSEVLGNRIALHFSLASAAPANDNGPHASVRRVSLVVAEQSMEIVLTREWLAVSEATLELNVDSGNCFTILVPSR